MLRTCVFLIALFFGSTQIHEGLDRNEAGKEEYVVIYGSTKHQLRFIRTDNSGYLASCSRLVITSFQQMHAIVSAQYSEIISFIYLKSFLRFA